jgi:hypothetical protein
MLGRLVATSVIALILAAQGSASSTASPQQRLWKRQIQPASSTADRASYPRPHLNYIGWAYVHHSPGRWVYFGPSYTFEPRKGIIDEACNLPTSVCPPNQRDAY